MTDLSLQITTRFITTNGLFVVGIAIIILIVAHLVLSLHERGWQRTYDRLGNKAAISILIYVFGETNVRAWSGLRLFYITHKMPVDFINGPLVVWPICGAAVALVGAVCMMRVFSREQWGNKAWIASVIVAAAFVAFLQLI